MNPERGTCMFLLAVCALAMSGCCTEDATHCEGRELFRCRGNGSLFFSSTSYSWQSEKVCDAACVEDEGIAVCASSEEVDPECEGSSGRYCSGSEQIDCWHGYRVGVRSCEIACVEGIDGDGSSHAVCSLTASPTIGCLPFPSYVSGVGCHEGDVAICWYGYPTVVMLTCGAGSTCAFEMHIAGGTEGVHGECMTE
jgi:hypothetical protein